MEHLSLLQQPNQILALDLDTNKIFKQEDVTTVVA